MPLLRNISELAICSPNAVQQDAGLIRNAALAWHDDIITWVGPASRLPTEFSSEPVIDCRGGLLIPGLIDCHTHLCFGGWRADEFGMRLAGASYQEITQAGGGIRSTVSATRGASQGSLLRTTLGHLDQMLDLGITTVECKSGYGLDLANELKQLEVYRLANLQHSIDLVATFLGAHTIPLEYADNRSCYVKLLCEGMIPRVASAQLARFCDIYVEKSAFTSAEAREILGCARQHGLQLKIHADQLSDTGGALLAAEMGALSAEHLEYANEPGMAAMAEAGVIAVSLPLASLYLQERQTPSRKLLDVGVAVAIATDFNPGTAPSFHLPLAMTLACLQQSMTPQEVLMGATSVAAKAIGEQSRIGSLQVGYQADMALIDASSLNQWLYHYRANACQGVIKRGKWVKRGI